MMVCHIEMKNCCGCGRKRKDFAKINRKTIKKECQQSIFDTVVYIIKIPVDFQGHNLLEEQLVG